MSKTGTFEAEQSLNTPKSEEELADQILLAVSEGNEEEMDRLFSVEIQPDAADEEDEGSDEDPSDTETEEEDSTTDEDVTAEEDDSSARTTDQEMSPAEVRLAKLEKELADAKAVAGRTSHLASRLAQLENQLRQTESSKKKSEKDEADNKLRERIKKLKEIDPDTAEIFEELIAAREEVAKEQSTEASSGPDPVLQEEYYKVLAVHSDADQIFQHPYWHMWKQRLTPEQRAWAESDRSEQVIVALGAYKQFLQDFDKPAAQSAPAAQDEVVDATKTAREKKLQRSADSSDKPMKKAKQFDPEAAFNEAYAEIAKENGIAY